MPTRRLAMWIAFLSTAAIFAVTACGGRSSSPTGPSNPTPSADVTVTIQGVRGSQSFAPNPVTMRAGQTIAWRNGDAISHTATGDSGGFNTGIVAGGSVSSPITMSTAGAFTYHCSIHPEMIGSITVQ